MSMLSAQRDELRKCADALQDAIDNLNLGRITYEGLTDALRYGINDLRSAADTIWELRNKMCDMVDQREEAERLMAERDEWHRVAVSKQDIIDHMRDARADNTKLRELLQRLLTEYRYMRVRPRRVYLQHEARMRAIEEEMSELGIEVTR